MKCNICEMEHETGYVIKTICIETMQEKNDALREALGLAWRNLILYHEQDDYDEHPIDCLMCKLISKCGEALKASDDARTD